MHFTLTRYSTHTPLGVRGRYIKKARQLRSIFARASCPPVESLDQAYLFFSEHFKRQTETAEKEV
jgi:hypothetical protein